jgi:ABC-type arginine transport system ATPase subunit
MDIGHEDAGTVRQVAAQIARDVHLENIAAEELVLLPPSSSDATKSRYINVCHLHAIRSFKHGLLRLQSFQVAHKPARVQ